MIRVCSVSHVIVHQDHHGPSDLISNPTVWTGVPHSPPSPKNQNPKNRNHQYSADHASDNGQTGGDPPPSSFSGDFRYGASGVRPTSSGLGPARLPSDWFNLKISKPFKIALFYFPYGVHTGCRSRHRSCLLRRPSPSGTQTT
ncbi:malectin/receptor-like protein kinase family protein [Actinidia rufa]|uniref:Malectin/receptor-like protein kinase family protein n=1 Tax=Actinidia rufa TaxID=165716 RepID=A0A7J0DA99_9ERIC|nr:malectin/receptor-like protein kinase family protein [Actinidia rufa]